MFDTLKGSYVMYVYIMEHNNETNVCELTIRVKE